MENPRLGIDMISSRTKREIVTLTRLEKFILAQKVTFMELLLCAKL